MRKLVTIALAGALAMSLASTAVAATPPAATYHGTWDSALVCGETFADSGVWNVNLKNDGTASVSARIFKEGRPHAAWGGNYFHATWTQLPLTASADVFNLLVSDPFAMGVDLRFTLNHDGTLVYELTNYCDGGSSAYLTGHLSD